VKRGLFCSQIIISSFQRLKIETPDIDCKSQNKCALDDTPIIYKVKNFMGDMGCCSLAGSRTGRNERGGIDRYFFIAAVSVQSTRLNPRRGEGRHPLWTLSNHVAHMPVLAYVLHTTVSRGFTVTRTVVPATAIFSLINRPLTCYERHEKGNTTNLHRETRRRTLRSAPGGHVYTRGDTP